MKKILKKLGLKKKSISVDEALINHIDPHAEDKTDFFKHEILVLGLIVFSLIFLVTLGVYSGLVTYHEGQAGRIYELELQFKRASYHWAGMYGASFGVGVNQPWEFNLTPGSMTEANVFFECFENGIAHELYASTVPLDQLDTSTLQAASVADLDAFTGIPSTAYDATSKTYTQFISVQFGANQINNIPAVFTNVGTGTTPQTFDAGLLKDANGNVVVVGHIFENLTRGFNDRFYNYQLLLPMKDNASTMYYLFTDPNDVCLGGSANPEIVGIVNGTVTDTSGNPIEDTVIVVGGDSTVSESDGTYSLITEVGNQSIIAIKEGYKVYQNYILIEENNVTTHNIVLELDAVPNQYTDIGPSFESGVDDAGTDIGPGEVPFQIEYPEVIEGKDFIVALNEINRRLREGEFAQETVYLYSYKESTSEIDVILQGDILNFTVLDTKKLFIPSNGDGSFTLTFFANMTPGIYNGTINLTGDIQAVIPVRIEIVDKNMIPVQALLLSVAGQETGIYPGGDYFFRTDLTNLLTDREYPVSLTFSIQNLAGTQTIWTYKSNVLLKTQASIQKKVLLPPDMAIDDFVLRVTANYLDLTSSASLVFTTELPFLQRIIFGKIRMWHLLLGLITIALLILAFIFIKRNLESKKKYHLKVELNELPKAGPRSILVGKIAETQNKSYMNLENFKTHTIVAGSTGGGKSFSAQVIIEEMLLKDVAVIVFDPTAQWTGMLRKLQNQGLLALYPNYGLKPKDARAFKGNIRQINNAREIIDIREYMKPGEIQVFACHKLDPKDIDMFVANSVRQVFRSAFDESEPLRLMLVYDEVHRLLPKFGGSGEGFLQIERACREFRKWGIGVMLISQVLADFVGQIKANINTEIQMRTRDEGDLERIKTKYGADILQSLVKASVGTGMVQNSAYNRGRPYFTTFRPIMHSVARLTDEEIEQYNKYNEQINQVNYELEQLEELKQDVFDLKLEVKLALDKIKAGNFNMGQIYLEGVLPRIKKFWDKLGKEPKKLEIKVVSEEEMKAELENAKQEREKAEAGKKKVEGNDGQAAKPKTPQEKFRADVPPDKILHLHNDMLVVNAKTLATELEAMKDKDFEFHVTQDKNDFADWLRTAVDDYELAELVEQEIDKAEIIKLLNMREKGEKLPKFVKKKETTSQQKKEAFEEMAAPVQDANTQLATDSLSTNQNDEKEVKSISLDENKESAQQEYNPLNETQPKPTQQMPAQIQLSQQNTQNEASQTQQQNEQQTEETPVVQKDKSEESENNLEVQNAKAVFDELSKNPQDLLIQENSNQTVDIQDNKNNELQQNPIQHSQEYFSQQNSQVTQQSNSKYDVQTTEDKYFRLQNGKELKSINDLKTSLPQMSEEVFHNHVREDQNDFANWIKFVFHEEELANKIKDVRDKHGLEEVLASG